MFVLSRMPRATADVSAERQLLSKRYQDLSDRPTDRHPSPLTHSLTRDVFAVEPRVQQQQLAGAAASDQDIISSIDSCERRRK